MDDLDEGHDDMDNLDEGHGELEVFSGDYFTDYWDDGLEWPDKEQEESDDENDRIEDFVDIVPPTSSDTAEESPFDIQQFPLPTAGAQIPDTDCAPSTFEAYQQSIGGGDNYAPFNSRLDWHIARWAKTHRLSSSAVTELFEIEGVRQYLYLLNFE
jgi:hypothetical protein